MKHVLIYGPGACGKTRNKAALAKAYGCGNIKEEPDKRDLTGQRSHSAKTLFLMTADSRHHPSLGLVDHRLFDIVPFPEAMRESGLQA